MTAPVHIESMGWVGAILALNLDRAGHPFTWHDTGAVRVAWRASNGVVYPDGDPTAQAAKAGWDAWVSSGLLPHGTVTPALFAYSQKTPPHGGTYKPIRLWGPIHSSPPGEAYIVNVAAVVAGARKLFSHLRLDGPPAGSTVVVAHGSSERNGGYDWGWTAKAALALPDEAAAAVNQAGGIQLYGRVNRFELAHATTIPGEPGRFRIGTSSQNSPRSRPAAALEHLTRRIGQLETLFPGVRVSDVEPPTEGWRPRNRRPADAGPLWLRGRLVLPPAGHNGVRLAPNLIGSAMRELEVAGCVAPST